MWRRTTSISVDTPPNPTEYAPGNHDGITHTLWVSDHVPGWPKPLTRPIARVRASVLQLWNTPEPWAFRLSYVVDFCHMGDDGDEWYVASRYTTHDEALAFVERLGANLQRSEEAVAK